jgi:hypothetical protein
MSRFRARTRAALPSLASLALAATLVTGLGTVAHAANDDTCVGKGEFGRIKPGMSIDKLGMVLHGQAPFAQTTGMGRQRYRWYVACEAWEPDMDVAVRYHQPIVGRRTVTKKRLDVYAPTVG